jgi:hypothetical protein
MSHTIISLTTIPPRMAGIAATLDSLVRQTAPIEAVILWVPERYRRAGFGRFDLPDLPTGIELRRCPIDYGPATKILPAIAACRGQDMRILYCDDDRIYHPDWAAHLLQENDRHPDDCTVEAGEHVADTILHSVWRTRRFQRLRRATLGIYGHSLRNKVRSLGPAHGVVDIALGCGGVLVRPAHLPDSAFDIPDLLWTVDDIWLSGQMALNGVTIRKASRRMESTRTDLGSVSALHDLIHDDHSQGEANLACIRYFQQSFGIWTEREPERARSSAAPDV